MVCFEKNIQRVFYLQKKEIIMEKLKILKELVNIRSFDTNQNKEIIDYLELQFKPFSQEIIKVKNKCDGRESLLVGINTKLKNISDAVVLSGHIDTVVANEKAYKTNPYVATIIDEKMYGLGIIDMKAYFACILNNIKELKKLDKPVVVAISGDEETRLEGVINLTQKMKELNIVPEFTIVGEPTSNKVCTASKSCYEYQVDIFGKSCHSSAPKNGINANYVAARIMLFVEKLCSKIKNTTLSCNVVSGGEKVNIISAKASLVFDVRSSLKSEKDKAISKLKKFIVKLEKKYGAQIVLTQNLSIPALEKRNSSKIESLIRVFNLEEDNFVGGCEAGYYQALGGDAIVFGVGDLTLAHKPNEYLVIDEFERYSKQFLKILKAI